MPPDRLDARTETAHSAASDTAGDGCLECGQPFTRVGTRAEFCSSPCRKSWNNRRMTRGAELYDLFMAHRFERARATQMGLLGLINRMASNFRAEDRERRAARRSWRDPDDVLESRPYLRARAYDIGRKRRK